MKVGIDIFGSSFAPDTYISVANLHQKELHLDKKNVLIGDQDTILSCLSELGINPFNVPMPFNNLRSSYKTNCKTSNKNVLYRDTHEAHTVSNNFAFNNMLSSKLVAQVNETSN